MKKILYFYSVASPFAYLGNKRLIEISKIIKFISWFKQSLRNSVIKKVKKHSFKRIGSLNIFWRKCLALKLAIKPKYRSNLGPVEA